MIASFVNPQNLAKACTSQGVNFKLNIVSQQGHLKNDEDLEDTMLESQKCEKRHRAPAWAPASPSQPPQGCVCRVQNLRHPNATFKKLANKKYNPETLVSLKVCFNPCSLKQ